ncbi:MAG: ATP-binding cassette domain-containing protein, partial [Aigarchaeota archaeon]|nr:ATP-binding cassette domain-containing protein [Aigarchaeota archaeon]
MSECLPVLKIEGLWKSYEKVQAVRGLDLQVSRGEILGLLGPNGSGKTTTVKAILRLTKKDSGKIWVLGQDIDQAPYEYKRWV